jgi:Uma2 family endonuclease
MSTVRQKPTTAGPPLAAGQRLDRAEFLRRYEDTPRDLKAELIGGVVYVASPVGLEHGRSSADAITWLGLYRARTPGVQALDNTTTALDDLGVPQPDVQLRILPAYGGQTRDEGKIVAGSPELVVEVSDTSRTIDLGVKRKDYERTEVQEYLVIAVDPEEVIWHVRRDNKLVRMLPDPDGLYRSKAFPGLWLDPEALLNEDLNQVIATLDRGLASPEHAGFIKRLATMHKRKKN